MTKPVIQSEPNRVCFIVSEDQTQSTYTRKQQQKVAEHLMQEKEHLMISMGSRLQAVNDCTGFS